MNGITPIDSAFEIIGLCNCYQLTHYIFLGTMAGAAIFSLGFIFSIWAVVTKGTLRPFFTFLILFFTLWALFVYPSAPVPTVTSAMEQNGYTDMTTQSVLNGGTAGSISNNTGSVNPTLETISNMFGSFVTGAIGAIDLGASNGQANYLKNPMAVAKIIAITNDMVSGGIKDPKVSKEVTNFYKSSYLPALQTLINNGTYTAENIPSLWPGDSRVVYADGGTAWNQVKTDLQTYLDGQGGTSSNGNSWTSAMFGKLASLTGQTVSAVQGNTIEALLKADMQRNASAYSVQSYNGPGYYHGAGVGTNILKFVTNMGGQAVAGVGVEAFQGISASIAQGMIQMMPYVQGYSLMLMFSFFPFVMVMSLLERRPGLLAEFAKYLFWVKSWSLTWAILDLASVYVVKMVSALAPAQATGLGMGGINTAFFNVATSVFMIMLPILSKAMIDGVFSGLGFASTAANLHVDKGVSVATSFGSSGVKHIIKGNVEAAKSIRPNPVGSPST